MSRPVSDGTKIEWADETWNPVTGCAKVSAGCQNCYAERLAPRAFAGQGVFNVSGRRELAFVDGGVPHEARPRRFTDVRCHPERLDKPLRWKKPRRVFVNSMSDLFHEDVTDEFICRVFNVMRACQMRHTFQVLTKRPERMRDVVRRLRFDSSGEGRVYLDPTASDHTGYCLGHGHNGCTGLTNAWLGVSCEDQATADERIRLLLGTPAAVRFVSAEPLLGPVTLWKRQTNGTHLNLGPVVNGRGLDWVIVGGESGPRARPCDIAWIRSIVEQCKAAVVKCFVKQIGSLPFDSQGFEGFRGSWDGSATHTRPKHPKGGNPSEWPEDLRVREMPS